MYGAQANQQQQQNQGMTALTSAATSLLPLLMSDERLKENINPVGKLNNGLTIYSFNYGNDPVTHVGLLAQEVEEVYPEAVAEVNGYKMVDYKQAVKEN